ncbi:MAG: hypothetical protein FWC47_01505 [Oscillospiraceae bacterium]|nr:hypothetical protein [Oscillospiraceae bacterium]
MATISVDYYFALSDGSTKILTLKDLKSDIDTAEILSFSDLLIEKEAVLKQVPIVMLSKCVKKTLMEETLK